jgi:hypothetical protein
VSATSTWASCGAMDLTGDPEGPPLALPWPVALRADALGRPFGLDARVLAERAAIAGLSRRGQVSCGGATRVLRARDGWVTLSLARKDDLRLLPALLGIDAADYERAWPAITAEVARRSALELDAQGELLGVGCSVVGAHHGPLAARGGPRHGAKAPAAPVVVDLSALWAGPLCTHLIQRAGALVIKVEDLARPDRAREGASAFFDLLNEGKQSVALNFRDPSGKARLANLLGAADVIVTSSRARAFEQLGILVDEVLSTASDKVWTAITAYGWASNRVGFGDDVAAGAGLVAWHPVDGEPRFCADAVADPLCGLEAAELTWDCLSRGGRWFIDASLAGAASKAAGPPSPARAGALRDGRWSIAGETVQAPRARSPLASARPLGSDTEAVLADLAR